MIPARVGARDLRLLPAALAGWAAALVGIGVASGPGVALAAGAGWLLALGISVLALRRSGPARLRPFLAPAGLALAAAALVLTAVAAHEPARHPPALQEAIAAARSVELVGRIAAPPAGGRADLAVDRLAGEPVPATPVLLFAAGQASLPGVGTPVVVRASLTATEPGDTSSALAFARGDVVVTGAAPPLIRAAADLRRGFRDLVRVLPGDGAGLLPGLAVGDTAALDPGLEQAMRVASLTHLTAVSGANCAVVVAVVVALAAAVGMRRSLRIAVALVALVGFVVLVTPEPSVQRAAVMAGVALVALILGRPASGIPLLGLAALALLVLDPWLARDYGFALSVLATGGLLLLGPPLTAVLSRVLPAPLAVVIAIPLAAQLACQPLLLTLDPSLPVYGVVANLLAEPAAPLATLAGLAACLLAPVVPPIALFLAALAWLPAAWVAAVARFTADLPGARGAWPVGPLGVVLLVSCSAVLLIALLAARGSRLRRVGALLAGIALLGYGGALVGGRLAVVSGRPADWGVAMCDVGQGDATVLRSAGRIAVVDTGPDPAALTACLADLGIGRVDLLVLTHYDLDHVGGTEALLGRVDRALVGVSDGADADALIGRLAAGGAVVEPVRAGASGRLGDLGWRALWPPPRGATAGNPASIALEVLPEPGCRSGCLRSLLLGDLPTEGQRRMAAAEDPGPVDVVKMSHHGSADQDPALYARVGAAVALIGVGADNTYGHPTASALGILDAAGTRALRTDRQGLLLVAPGPEAGSVTVWTARDGGGP